MCMCMRACAGICVIGPSLPDVPNLIRSVIHCTYSCSGPIIELVSFAVRSLFLLM